MTDVPRTVLRRYYDELMRPAFPEPELMTWDELSGALDEPGTDGLLVLEDDVPVAGLVTEEYLSGELLLLAYVVVAPGGRGRGWGSRLITQAVGHDGRLVLAEIEDPRFHEGGVETGDPTARLRFYERLGSRLLPIPYVQPSLRPGSPRVEDLLLITIPSAVTHTHVDGHLVRAFLDEYYEACEGEAVLTTDPSYGGLRTSVPDVVTLTELVHLDAARPEPPWRD